MERTCQLLINLFYIHVIRGNYTSWYHSLSLPQSLIPMIHDGQLHNKAVNDFIMLHGKSSQDACVCAVTHFDTLGWHLQPGPSPSIRQRHFLWGFQATRLGIKQWSTQEKARKGGPQMLSSFGQQLRALAQKNTRGNSSSLAAAKNRATESKASAQHLKSTSRNIPGSSQEPRQAFLFREKKIFHNWESAGTAKCCTTAWMRRGNIM